MTILKTINKYFPSYVEPFSSEYEQSHEYKKLLLKVLHYQKFPEYEENIYNKLKKSFSKNFFVIDCTKLAYLDRCFSYHIKETSENNKNKSIEIVFCVSILYPCYCIYEKTISQVNDNSENFIGFLDNVSFNFDNNDMWVPVLNRLRGIGSDFNLKEILSEDFLKHCEKYSFYGIPKEKFTIFNGLFKDSF